METPIYHYGSLYSKYQQYQARLSRIGNYRRERWVVVMHGQSEPAPGATGG